MSLHDSSEWQCQGQGDLLDLIPPALPVATDSLEEAAFDEWWKSCAMTSIRYRAEIGAPFTADDIRREVGEPRHPNHWGALFRSCRIEGLIAPEGVTQSTTKSRNGGLLRVWRGVAA